MVSGSKCIINAAQDKWYPLGQQRLVRSLIHFGYAGDLMTWTNEAPNEIFDPQCNYTVKAAALREAIDRGHQYVLWIDCSIWAIKDPNPFMKMLQHNGGFFLRSGFNCAQTSKDSALEYFGYTRDEAEQLPELWSCIFGFDMGNEQSKLCAEMFIQSARDGVFHGSREHDGQSMDSRFLFHRQDQTALSLAFHKSGLTTLHAPQDHLWSAHEGESQPGQTWAMRGL